MNKKVLFCAVALLALAVLVTPMVGTAQARGWGRCRKPKIVDVYTRTPGVDLPTVVAITDEPSTFNKVCGNGKIWITSGRQRTYVYGSPEDDRGPLGYGTQASKEIISVSEITDVWIPTATGEMPVAGQGFAIYKVTLTIEDGPYGTGTLSGIVKLNQNWDFTGAIPSYNFVGTLKFTRGTGDFAGVKVNIELDFSVFTGIMHTTTTVISR
jgi:hypothetical protein